jgi:hypothetical protein
MLQIKRSRSYQISGRVLVLPMLQIKRSRSYQISGRESCVTLETVKLRV